MTIKGKVYKESLSSWASTAVAVAVPLVVLVTPALAQSPFGAAATKVSADMTGVIAKAGVATAIVSTGLHYVVGHNGSHQALGKLFTAGTLMGLATTVATWIFT